MMKQRRDYTEKDLLIRKLVKVCVENGVISSTHTVEFGRALSDEEWQLFQNRLIGFYETVRASEELGGAFVAEPTFEFLSPHMVYYTFHQSATEPKGGEWKNLLLSVLSKFSYEVVPIVLHDQNRIFDPARNLKKASANN